MGAIDHARFIFLLKQRYPEIAASISDCSVGLLHPKMGTMSNATQAAIDAGDEDTVRQHFAFIEEVWANAAPDVDNAIHVSYLENLRFKGRPAGAVSARELLTPRMEKALAQIEAGWGAGQ